MKERVNVVCLYWSPCIRGRDFTCQDVERLRFNVDRYMDRPYNFYCLTNYEGDDLPAIRIPLKHKWPGWWSKMELHRDDLPQGRTLYLDQDTYVVDSLQPVLDYKGDLVLFNNRITKQQEGMVRRYQAGIMLFTPGKNYWMYKKFEDNVANLMSRYRGDQDLIGLWSPHLPTFPDEWMEKASKVFALKTKPKELIFITGQPKDINFRDIPKQVQWIQDLI